METRREFLKKTTAATALGLFSGWTASCTAPDKLGEVLPTRQLLRTGEKVTTFCLGGYHAGIPENETDAQKIIEKPLNWESVSLIMPGVITGAGLKSIMANS